MTFITTHTTIKIKNCAPRLVKTRRERRENREFDEVKNEKKDDEVMK